MKARATALGMMAFAISSAANLFVSALTVTTSTTKKHDGSSPVVVATRRQALVASWGMVSTAFLTQQQSANAFSNKVSNKYDDRPKQRGSQPRDLGVDKRQSMDGETYLGLKPCRAPPDCFCSTTSIEDDPDHSIPPFVWPQSLDQAQAMKELQQVLEAYQPGQNGVDGGGFEIRKVTPNYIYVQYESLKNGFIDDVEFAVIDGYGPRQVQVRSSSRLGYLDYGVNSKRLNAIANALRSKGWDAVGVDYSAHQFYALENQVS